MKIAYPTYEKVHIQYTKSAHPTYEKLSKQQLSVGRIHQ